MRDQRAALGLAGAPFLRGLASPLGGFVPGSFTIHRNYALCKMERKGLFYLRDIYDQSVSGPSTYIG